MAVQPSRRNTSSPDATIGGPTRMTLAALILLSSSAEAVVPADEVLAIPGFPPGPYPFKIYSGFLNVSFSPPINFSVTLLNHATSPSRLASTRASSLLTLLTSMSMRR